MCAVPRNACIPTPTTPPHPSVVFVCTDNNFMWFVTTDFPEVVKSFKKAPSSDGVTCFGSVRGRSTNLCVKCFGPKDIKRRYPILQFRGAIVNISMHLLSSNVRICNVLSLSIRPDDNLITAKEPKPQIGNQHPSPKLTFYHRYHLARSLG